jgi:hypothetical protein
MFTSGSEIVLFHCHKKPNNMILIIRVLHDFNSMNVPAKIAFGPIVVTKMTANAATFVTPRVPLATLTSANTDLNNKYQAWLSTGDSVRQALEDSERNWLRLYRQQADYVDGIANGDGAIIELSGFHHTKEESDPTKKPDMPQNADAFGLPHTRGAIHATAKKQKGINGHVIIAYSPEAIISINGSQVTCTVNHPPETRLPPTVFSVVVETAAAGDMLNLTSLTSMIVQQAQFNRAGMSEFTPPDPVTIP